MSAEDPIAVAEQLLEELEAARVKLEAAQDADEAIAILQQLAELAKRIDAELQRARGDAEAGTSAQDDG